MTEMEHTVGREAVFRGRGLFGGTAVDMTVGPAPPGSGLVFVREDLTGAPEIPARWDHVIDARNRTRLGDGAAEVSTVEHILAALAGLAIDNARLSLSGPEVPALDGASEEFAAALEEAGVAEQARPRSWIRILRTVEVADGARSVRVDPGDGFSVDGTIEYPGTVIGRQQFSFSLERDSFRGRIAGARTFCTREEMEEFRLRGLGRGGTAENTVVVNGTGILGGGALRYKDEFIRHKVLDCLGDLYLAGGQILGRVTFVRGGHEMNRRLLQKVFADPANWEQTSEGLLALAA